MSLYKTLLNVVIEHDYHQGGLCPCLRLRPSDKTLTLLENAGLLCQEFSGGIRILYDNDRLEALQMMARDQLEPISFDFKVYSDDPHFKNYTEPFAADTDGLFCFSNHEIRGIGKQALPTPEFVPFEQIRNSDASVRRESELGEFKTELSPRDRFLRELSDMLDPRDLHMPPEFVLRIYADNLQGSLLKQWLETDATVYSIKLNSRQRYWKYYLLGKIVHDSRPENVFFVVDPDKRFEFEATGEETLADRNTAFTFRSKQQIPLNEHYAFRFQLKQKTRNGETVIIPRLPFASIERVGMDAISERETIVSEIYINS